MAEEKEEQTKLPFTPHKQVRSIYNIRVSRKDGKNISYEDQGESYECRGIMLACMLRIYNWNGCELLLPLIQDPNNENAVSTPALDMLGAKCATGKLYSIAGIFSFSTSAEQGFVATEREGLETDYNFTFTVFAACAAQVDENDIVDMNKSRNIPVSLANQIIKENSEDLGVSFDYEKVNLPSGTERYVMPTFSLYASDVNLDDGETLTFSTAAKEEQSIWDKRVLATMREHREVASGNHMMTVL